MKIYIDGIENIGWAIDSNRANLQEALKRLMFDETDSVLKADIVHNIWWDNLFNDKIFKTILSQISEKRSNLIVSAMNFIDFDPSAMKSFNVEVFNKVKSVTFLWIAPGSKQLGIFDRLGINAECMPLLVDTKLFRPLRDKISKMEIAQKYNIPWNLIKDKVIIGSFQRDSLGSDLTKPKWQKGPDILLELLKILPRDKYVLLLTSPRRHYLISECKKNHIPFFYLGTETKEDDIILNNLDHGIFPELYNLLDLYLIASRSEGGPTAIIESTSTKTFVLSTDVGLASDYLVKENIFSDIEKYKAALFDYVTNFKLRDLYINTIVEKQFKKCMELSSDDAIDNKLKYIYSRVLNKNGENHT
jgi:hypothetical protein